MRIVRVGVLALAAAATVGLLGLFAYGAQVDLPSEVFWWVFLPFPSASTAIGYGLVFYGWRRGTPVERSGLPEGSDVGRIVPR